MKKYLFLFLILILFLCFQYGLIPFSGHSPDSARIIAHRGDSAHAPENTIPAFLSAIQSGADSIEMDIRCTRDDVPVVFHDANLRRLTGSNCFVADLNCTDFLSHPLALSEPVSNYPQATPCTLEDAIALCSNHPGLCLHLELKVSGIEEKVVSLLQKYDSVCSYEISSADPAVLKKIKQIDPDTETFLLLSSVSDIRDYILQATADIDGISVRSLYVTALLTSIARKRGHKIYAWTVNDTFRLRRLCRLHVNGIITDNPLLLRKMLS